MQSILSYGKANRGSIALVGFAALCLLPFLRLAFFAHPYLDDFGLPALVRQQGIWAFTGTMYTKWQGRFSTAFITALHPLAWGSLKDVQPFVFGFILAVAGSVLFAGGALLRGPAVPLPTRLAAGSTVLAPLLLLLASPPEAFYWLIGALYYMGGAACCLLLLGVVARLHGPAPPLARRAWWLAAAVLAVLAPGFSEMISCFVLALVVVLAPQLWQRRLGRGWGLLLGLAVGASAVATLAPGNFVRANGSQHLPLLRSVGLAGAGVAYTLVGWLSNGFVVVLTLLLLPAMQRLVQLPGLPLARLVQRPWRWPLWLLLGLGLCYVFTHLAAGGPPPSRARNLLLALFLVGWFMSVAGLMAHRVRLGRPVPGLPAYGRAVLTALLLLLITSDHNFRLRRDLMGAPTNSVAQAYRDWLSGEAARYDREEEARYALIARTKSDTVELPMLSVQPVSLVWWDISPNPNLWGNRVYADYFHKKAIVVKP